MKKIFSFLMALVMLTSTLVFCFAETEIIVDVRLEVNNETREVDMVFSLPENSGLTEFGVDVSYLSDVVFTHGTPNEDFVSNLSADEEEFFNWDVDTNGYARAEEGERPVVIINGYCDPGKELNNGGDFFTLTFNMTEYMNDQSFGFTIDTKYLLTEDGASYDDAVVPVNMSCIIEDNDVTFYNVEYDNFTAAEVEMEQIKDQSKLNPDHNQDYFTGQSGSTRMWKDLPNSINYEDSGVQGATNLEDGSWNGGAWIPCQPFKTSKAYARYLKPRVSVSGGTMTIRARTNTGATRSGVVVSGDVSAGSGDKYLQYDISSNATLSNLSNGGTYYLQWGYKAGAAGSGHSLLNWSCSTGCYMSMSGNAKYRLDDHNWWFQIGYDTEIPTFITAVSNLGSSGSSATNDYKNKLTAALNAYNALDNNNVKNTVSSQKSTYDTRLSQYNSAVSTAATNWANSVNNLASGGLTNSEIATLTTLRTNYNNLCTDAKNNNSVKNALTVLTNMENAKSVVSTINGLTVNWANRTNVTNAYNSYTSLASGPKGYVPSDLVTKVTNGNTTIDKMSTAGTNFINAAVAIGEVDYTSASKALIDDARAKYEVLESFNDSTLTGTDWATEHLAILQAAEAEYARLESEVTQFRQAMSNMQPGDIDAANALKEAYEGFTEGQKAAVSAEYEMLMALGVRDLIDACYPVDLDKAEEIEAARTSFDNLPDELKALIGEEYINKLIAAEELYDEILAKIDALEEEIALIEKPYDIDDADAIYAAKEKYDAFTSLQQEAVENRQDLLDAINALLEAENKIQEVEDLIDAIGNVTYGKLLDIEAAREAYELLSDDQKAQVSNLDVLEAAEEIITIIEEGYFGDINLDDNVDIMDAIFILHVGITKIPVASLELKQIILGDVDGNGKFDPQDALLVLHYFTNKIYYFPVEEVYWE